MSKSFNRSNKLNAKNHNARTLQIESLENRELLSVVSPFASADNLTETVSALVSTTDPANVGFLTNTNQDIPLPPQYKAPQLAPTEGGLSVPLDQTAPLPLTVGNTNATVQVAETPLVVELETPLVQTTPMAASAGTTPTLISETPLVVDLDTPQIQTTPRALAANNTAAKKFVVNTVDDVVNNDRYTSLREAIQNATDGSVITFASSLKGKTINVNSCLNISKGITIDASSLYDAKNNEPGLTINILTNRTDPGIMIKGSNTVTIKGLEFISTYEYNGIVCGGASGSVTNIQNCHFHSLYCACHVGYAEKVTVNLDNCIISNMPYGALANHKGVLNINNCTLSNCYEAIYNEGGNNSKTVMTNSTISSSEFGINNRGTLSVSRCTFKNNKGGYLIYNPSGCTATLDNCLFVNNTQNGDYCCFDNYGSMYLTNITEIGNSRTFKNENVMYLRNSICSTKNYGNALISQRANCMTAAKAELDSNYRPTASSACVNAGNNSYNSTDKDLAGNKRIMGGTTDIGCYEYFPVNSVSNTSGKSTIKWEDAGVASYTVHYRVMGTEKWTSKTVKNKTEVTLSLKNNTVYEVSVAPEGTNQENGTTILTCALAKLGVKVASKTENSISFKLSNSCGILGTAYILGIQKQNEDMEYYNFSDDAISSMRFEFSNLTYTFKDNILTINGLDSNTKYKFDFQQCNYRNDSSAISTPASVSITTNKTIVTQTIVVKSATQSALKDAINLAPEGAVITFDKSLDGKTITLSQALTISRGVTIDASNLGRLTILRNYQKPASDGLYKAFLISDSKSTVKFVGITFKEDVGYIIDDGVTEVPYRAIETQNFKGNLIIEVCCFDANCTQHILSKDASNITVRGTRFYNDIFSGNTCIVKHIGKLFVENCEFWSSSGHHISGCNGATIIVRNSSFNEDVYGTNGKATVFYLQGASILDASGCEFSHCKNMLDTYNDSYVTMKDCIIFMCGKFYKGDITLIRCVIESCQAGMFRYTSLYCYNCVFDSNDSSGDYRMFYMPGYKAAFYNCTFSNNGAAIFSGDSSSRITVRNTITDINYDTSGFASSVWTNCVVTTVNPLYYYPDNSSVTINKGNNNYYPVGLNFHTDINGNLRIAGGTIDIGAVESYSVKARSTTSNKVDVSWEDYGVESYTVKYRVDGTTAWTSKVVKGKTSISLSVKPNQSYKVIVIPKGMEKREQSCQSTYGVALSKLTTKVSNKTSSSVSFQISQIATLPEMHFSLGIKKQSEKTYTYYTFYKENSGKLGSSSMSYTFNNGVLTIKGLDSGTTYNFQFAQQCDGGSWYDSNSISPYISVSAATN